MDQWLQNLPVVWMAVASFVLTYLVTAGIHLAVMGLVVRGRLNRLKGISPGMLPPLGIIFGLFVAFIAAQVWGDIDRGNTAVGREASALRTVVLLSASPPEEPRARLQTLVRQHIEEAVNREWPAMAQQSASLSVLPMALSEALHVSLALEPRSLGQTEAQRQIVAALENAMDARRQRIIVSGSTVNGVKWA